MRGVIHVRASAYTLVLIGVVLLPSAVFVYGQRRNVLLLSFAAIGTSKGFRANARVRGWRSYCAIVPVVRGVIHVRASAYTLVLLGTVLLPSTVFVLGQHRNVLFLGFGAIGTGISLRTNARVRGWRGDYAIIPVVRGVLGVLTNAHALVLIGVVLLPCAVFVCGQRRNVLLLGFAAIGTSKGLRANACMRGWRGDCAIVPVVRGVIHVRASAYTLVLIGVVLLPCAVFVRVT